MFDFGFIRSQHRTIGLDSADLKAYYQMVKRE
jgi:hypothetical protein